MKTVVLLYTNQSGQRIFLGPSIEHCDRVSCLEKVPQEAQTDPSTRAEWTGPEQLPELSESWQCGCCDCHGLWPSLEVWPHSVPPDWLSLHPQALPFPPVLILPQKSPDEEV